jgi:glycosyltransferase involved in cell wall biosynthesis
MDGVFLYDTGSTDRTIQVAKETCKHLGLKLNVLEGTFVNFAVSRNVLFDHIATFNTEKSRETMMSEPVGKNSAIAERLRKKLEEKRKEEAARDTKKSNDSVPIGVKWLILLDANDELQGMDDLRKYLNGVRDEYDEVGNVVKLRDVVYIRQRWRTNGDNFTNFKNQRCVRSDSTMRYSYVVHEVLLDSECKCNKCGFAEIQILKSPNPLDTNFYIGCPRCEITYFKDGKKVSGRYEFCVGPNHPVKPRDMIFAPDSVVIFQDRTLDTTMSSERRFARDRMMLQEQYDMWPYGKKDSRYTFYLAQTYKCLGDTQSSLKYYTERYHIKSGFQEEIYVSAWEIARILYQHYMDGIRPAPKYKALLTIKTQEEREAELNSRKPVPLSNVERNRARCDYIFYIFEVMRLDTRVEPLVHIAEVFMKDHLYEAAYMFSRFSLMLRKPEVLLWYEEQDYKARRYLLHSIICDALGYTEEANRAREKISLTERDTTSFEYRLTSTPIKPTIVNGERRYFLETIANNGSAPFRRITPANLLREIDAASASTIEHFDEDSVALFKPSPAISSHPLKPGDRMDIVNRHEKWFTERFEAYKSLVPTLLFAFAYSSSYQALVNLAKIFHNVEAYDNEYMVLEYILFAATYSMVPDDVVTYAKEHIDLAKNSLRRVRRSNGHVETLVEYE